MVSDLIGAEPPDDRTIHMVRIVREGHALTETLCGKIPLHGWDAVLDASSAARQMPAWYEVRFVCETCLGLLMKIASGANR